MSLFTSNYPPPPERRRLFRNIMLALVLVTAILVGLQYTAHALFPAEKTETLWGLLTGFVLMGAFVLVRWSRGAKRGP